MDMEQLSHWLIGEARLSDDAVKVAEGLGARLVEAGVPVWRMRIAQLLSNPLLSAWGVIWRNDGTPVEQYTVPTAILNTPTWVGSPFQIVTDERITLHKPLQHLDLETDHALYHELAESGATDFFAMPLESGDGGVQGCSFTSNHPEGFSEEHVALLESLRLPLSAAMEPIAMRRSKESLLKTYLGSGASAAVVAGAVRRGELSSMKAVVMFSDLRGFTAKSNSWEDETLLEALNQYFEIVVEAVHAGGGDVLKFLGDGILAVFPVEADHRVPERCAAALEATLEARKSLETLNRKRAAEGLEAIDFGTALHLGEVSYGNIGSADRLDFTVIGETVNLASRVEGLCKELGAPLLCTETVAHHLGAALKPIGAHTVRGIADPVELFVPA